MHDADAESAASSDSNGSNPEIVPLAQTSGAPRVAGPPRSHHDPHNCPICDALSNVHAAVSVVARIPETLESGPAIIAAENLTLPSSDFASADARAPPSA